MGDIAKSMSEGVGDVWLLQEPYMVNGLMVGIGSVRVFYVGENPRGAIAVNNDNCDVFFRNDVSDEDAVFAIITRNSYSFGVGSVYCPIDIDIEISIYKIVRGIVGLNNLPFIIGADANAVSPLWHSKNVGASRNREIRGETLTEFLTHNNLNVVNMPSEFFTFSGPQGSSDIDLTITEPGLIRDFSTTWTVCPELGISDHNLIRIELIPRISDAPPVQALQYKNYKVIDWEIFNSNICAQTPDQFGRMSLNEMIETFNGWIDGATKTIPEKSTIKNNVRWWTPELTALRKRVRKERLSTRS